MAGLEPATNFELCRPLCQTELHPGIEAAGLEPATACAQPSLPLSYIPNHEQGHDGWTRTSDSLCVKQALLPSELHREN
jgi:hypothetical protein